MDKEALRELREDIELDLLDVEYDHVVTAILNRLLQLISIMLNENQVDISVDVPVSDR